MDSAFGIVGWQVWECGPLLLLNYCGITRAAGVSWNTGWAASMPSYSSTAARFLWPRIQDYRQVNMFITWDASPRRLAYAWNEVVCVPSFLLIPIFHTETSVSSAYAWNKVLCVSFPFSFPSFISLVSTHWAYASKSFVSFFPPSDPSFRSTMLRQEK